MIRIALPKELQSLSRSEWDRLIGEAAIDDESALIADMYIHGRRSQTMIADLLQEHGIYLSQATVSRRWKEFLERAVEIKNLS